MDVLHPFWSQTDATARWEHQHLKGVQSFHIDFHTLPVDNIGWNTMHIYSCQLSLYAKQNARKPNDTHTCNTCVHFTLAKIVSHNVKHIPRTHLLHSYIYKYLLHIYVCMHVSPDGGCRKAQWHKRPWWVTWDGLIWSSADHLLIKTPLGVYSSLQVPSSVVCFTYTKGSWWMVTICNRWVGFWSAFLCGNQSLSGNFWFMTLNYYQVLDRCSEPGTFNRVDIWNPLGLSVSPPGQIIFLCLFINLIKQIIIADN